MKPRSKLLLSVFAVATVGAAVGPIVSRLRDLSDVRLSGTPTSGHALIWNGTQWTNGAVAGLGGSVGFADFNTGQFGTNNGTVSVKSGAVTTNLDNRGYLLLSGQTNQLTISGGVLYLDGVPVTSASGAPITNIYAITVNNTTNIFLVAKGAHVVVSNSITILPLLSKLLRTDSTGLVTNVVIGTGLTFDGTTISRDALTGDVTTSANAATIANDAVTYAKMQNVSATARVIGRNTAGSGDPEEVTGTQVLDWIGSTRGNVLYRGASAWSVLTPGTSGYLLQSGGAGADPSWVVAPSGGLATTGSAYAIVGGSATATVNWTSLSNAYVTAKTATPHGSALAAGNRYTILLLPGKYDLGASTFTLDTEFIDIVGLSKNAGPLVYSGTLADLGDTVLTSTGSTLSTSNVGNQDMMIANLCLETTTSDSTTYGITTSHTGFGSAFKASNILIAHNGSANPKRGMVRDKNFGGTWIDVRCWVQHAFGEALFSSITVNGTFIRCKGANKCFGEVSNPGSTVPTLSGTFIDCEGDANSFGDTTTAAGSVLSGTFIRCRMVGAVGGGGRFMGGTGGTMSGYFQDCVNNVTVGGDFGGGVMSGTMVGCSTISSISWTSVSGKVVGCNFPYVTTFPNAIGTTDTTAAVNIAATGWTNTFGKQAVVYFDGTAVTATVYNNAGTAVYTNAVALSGGSIILQPSGKVILSGTSVTGRAMVF